MRTMSDMGFHDLIKQFREADRESLSDEIWDQLATEYDSFVQASDAKVNDISQAVAQREAEIQRLKVVNYDLLTSGTESGGGGTGGQNPPNEDDDKPLSIDDLFGPAK